MAMLQQKSTPASQGASVALGASTKRLAVAARANLSGAVSQPHPADPDADPFLRVSEFSLETRSLRVVELEPAPADDSDYW